MDSGESANTAILVVSTVILFGIPSVWCIVNFGFQAAKDIVGLSETKIAAITSLIICMSILILNIAAAVIIIVQAQQSENFWLLVLAIPPLSVIVAGIGAILFTDYHFRRKYESSHSSFPPRIQNIVQSIADELDLPKAPSLYVTTNNRSPFCYGRSSNSAKLFLPENFEKICMDAAEGREEKTSLLMRFIIAHELSHIKNGDCTIMTCLTLFYRYMRVAIAFAGVCILFSTLINLEQSLIVILKASFLLTVISIPCLKWTIAMISRNREFSADARSSLLFDRTTLHKLVGEKRHDLISAFEYITIFLSMQLHTSSSPFKFKRTIKSDFGIVAELGWAEPRVSLHLENYFSRIWNRAFCFHPKISKRREVLLKATSTRDLQPYPSQLSSVQIHVVSTLCFLALFTTLYIVVFPVLRSGLALSESRKSTLGVLVGVMLLVFAFFPAIVHSVPARISSIKFGEKVDHFKTLGKRYTIGAIFGFIVLVPLLLLLMVILPQELFGDVVNRYISIVASCVVCQIIGLGCTFGLTLAAYTGTSSNSTRRIFNHKDFFTLYCLYVYGNSPYYLDI
ncbi:MAG: M48 family metalloprotease [Planctomycetes bacterium]|nr:M48 family metalloprotease [Planctomycetota bacterium]MBL7145602.1 M48 family metalloprotease [Phycisphaerae bacterium]